VILPSSVFPKSLSGKPKNGKKGGYFSTEQYRNLKEYRIGTLLPPFITRLVQKYALYMQRQGLPRIPEEATK